MSTIKVSAIKNASSSDGGIAIDTSGHVTVDGQQLPTEGALSNRNFVINGAMQVAQRGTSFTYAHDGTVSGYNIDRMSFVTSGADSYDCTVSQSTDAPSGFAKSWKVTTGTAEASIDANDLIYFRTVLEAQNLQPLDYGSSSAKTITVSFYVKSSVSGTFGLGLYVEDGVRNRTSTYTINATNTWERKTVTFTGDTASSIDDNNGRGLDIYWVLASGSDWDSTDSTSWDDYVASRWAFGHAQDGVATTASATWQITGIQLELGNQATPFEHKSFSEELQKCKRYFQRSYPYGTATGTATYSGATIYRGNTATTVTPYVPVRFETEMRATPDIELRSPDSGAADTVSAGIGSGGSQVAVTAGVSSSGATAFMYYNAGTSSPAYYNLYAHHICTSELT